MSILDEVLKEEYERLNRIKIVYQGELESLSNESLERKKEIEEAIKRVEYDIDRLDKFFKL